MAFFGRAIPSPPRRTRNLRVRPAPAVPLTSDKTVGPSLRSRMTLPQPMGNDLCSYQEAAAGAWERHVSFASHRPFSFFPFPFALSFLSMANPNQPEIKLVQGADYRDGYANTVQVRMSVWDFFLVFGTLQQASES